MTLQHVTDDLPAQALVKPGITHSIGLKRGLRLALRYRTKHYTLSISRLAVYPSVAEKAVLRRSFNIPHDRKWRTHRHGDWHTWHIFWNPDESDTQPLPLPRRQLPTAPNLLVGPDFPAGELSRDRTSHTDDTACTAPSAEPPTC